MRTLSRFTFFIITFFIANNLLAQTTGKIAGTVLEKGTDEPLIGANVVVEGTAMGASVSLDGSFFILNIPPGTYNVSIEMIGFKTYKVENLRVSVNRTSYIDANLELAIIEGDVIIVQADKTATKKDQTSSMRTISSEQMELLPVEDLVPPGDADARAEGGVVLEIPG